MKPCPACRREVQSEASECPHCGVVFAKWRPRDVIQASASNQKSENRNEKEVLAASEQEIRRSKYFIVAGVVLLSGIIFGLPPGVLLLIGLGLCIKGLGRYTAAMGRRTDWVARPNQPAEDEEFSTETPQTRSDIRSYLSLRRYRMVIWVFVGLALGYYSHRSFTFLGPFTVVAAIIAVILIGFLASILAILSGVLDKFRNLIYDGLSIAVYCVVLALLFAHGFRSVTANLERETTPVIDALERYQKDTGAYPETLDNLIPAYLSNMPDCPGARSRQLKYWYHDGNYGLFCYNGPGISKYQYNSNTKTWQQVWD